MLLAGTLLCAAAAGSDGDDVDPRTLYDAVDCRIELLIDPRAQIVRGFAALAGVVTAEQLDVVVLDLVDDLVVQSAATIDGDFFRKVLATTRAAPFEREADTVRVKLPRPLPRGERFQVLVAYAGKPTRRDDFNGFQWATTPTGAPWIATSCQTLGASTWWPCKDSFFHPEDKADRFAISATVPAPLVVASNGRLLDVEHHGELSTWRWRLDAAVPTYAIALAIAPYVVIEEELALPGLEHPLPLRYYVLPGSEAKARAQFAQVPDLLTFFSGKFGPFPFPDAKFCLAETPIWGMEHATVIAYGNSFPDAIRGTGVVDPYELRNKLYDYVLVHEAAHEWWGNAISCADWGDFWLHEGFATYAETLWVEHRHGLDAALQFMQEKKAGISELATVWRPRRATAADAYDTQMYDKGAFVLQMLRYLLGDEKFFAALREFATAPHVRFGVVTTADFQAICEKHHGASLRGFFQPWLYGTRWPSYTVHQPKLEGSKATVAIECKADGQFPYEMPLDIAASLADGTRFQQRVLLTKGTNRVELDAPAVIKSVEFPGFRWILCDVRFVP